MNLSQRGIEIGSSVDIPKYLQESALAFLRVLASREENGSMEERSRNISFRKLLAQFHGEIYQANLITNPLLHNHNERGILEISVWEKNSAR